MAASASGVVDPTKPAKYPVILSDALRGKAPKDVFTGIKYNHKPALSSETAPAHARLKPSIPGSSTSYDVSFQDDGGKYAYAGTRTTEDGKYVLYFDPARKAFILDRIDSTFHMNLTRTPGNTDPESLQQEFPHLDISNDGEGAAPARPAKSTKADATSKAKAAASGGKSLGSARKPEKRKEIKNVALQLPQAAKPAAATAAATAAAATAAKQDAKRRAKQPADDDEDDEEDDDDDGGLVLEFPDGEPARPAADFSPAFPSQFSNRRFSDFIRDSEADEDADGEFDDDAEAEERELDVDTFKLPSPMNNPAPAGTAAAAAAAAGGGGAGGGADADADADADLDLEAEFENALEEDLLKELEEEQRRGNSGSGDADSESEVSEED